MSDPLSEARIRTQRYWYRDGLEEITLGILFLLMGSCGLTIGTPWFMAATLIYNLLLLAFIFFVPRIKVAVRKRITYPRSGYVDPVVSWRKRPVVRGMLFALLGLVLVGAAELATRYAGRQGLDPARVVQWAPAMAGIATGAVCVYVRVRQGLTRFLVMGVFAMILGIAVSIEYPPTLAIAIYTIGVGCASLCSGGVTLWNYIRTAAPSADET